MNRKTVFGIVLSSLVAASLVGARWATLSRRPRAVVEGGAIERRVLARAVVEATDGVAEVRARTDGRVKRVLVRCGDHVEAGDLLAEIEEDGLATEVTRRDAERRAAELSAETVAAGARPEERAVTAASLESARRAATLAEDRATREAKLKASGSTSDASELEARLALEIARAKVAELEAQVALARAGGRGSEARAARLRAVAAEAAQKLAESTLARTHIVAGTRGAILERRIDPGDTITGTEMGGPPLPVFEIADTDRLEVRIEVEDRDATRLAIGQEVIVTPEGSVEVLARATLTRIAPQLASRSLNLNGARVRADGRVRAAWATLDGPASRSLVIGQQLEARVVLSREQVQAMVPRRAVQVRDGRAVVDRIWGPLVREIPVQLLATDEASVEVRDLTPGVAVLLH